MAIDLTASYCNASFELTTAHITVTYWGTSGDTGRGMFIELKSGGVIQIPTTETLIMYATRPDNTRIYIVGEKDGNKIRLDFNNSVFEVYGTVTAELHLIAVNGLKKISNTFDILAYEGVFNAPYVTSSNEFQALTAALETVESLQAQIDALTLRVIALEV